MKSQLMGAKGNKLRAKGQGPIAGFAVRHGRFSGEPEQTGDDKRR